MWEKTQTWGVYILIGVLIGVIIKNLIILITSGFDHLVLHLGRIGIEVIAVYLIWKNFMPKAESNMVS